MIYEIFLALRNNCAILGRREVKGMNLKKYVFLAGLFLCAAFSAFGESKNAKWMDKVVSVDEKLNISKDEIAIYYVRNDGKYEPWALWIWEAVGGDGAAAWKYTQDWKVMDGVAYMRFKKDGSSTGGVKFVGNGGETGLIVRQDAGWTKDGQSDRFWNFNSANKVVILEGDEMTYPVGKYQARITSAYRKDLYRVVLELSDEYSLNAGNGSAGFIVKNGEGVRIEVEKAGDAKNPESKGNVATKKVELRLKTEVSLSEKLLVSHEDFAGECKVNAAPLSVTMAESFVPSKSERLGLDYDGAKAVFKLWAPTSTSCVLRLYKSARDDKAKYEFNMEKNEKSGVYSYTYEGNDIEGMFYDFEVENLKGKNKVLDPYALSMSETKTGELGRAAVINLNSKKAGAQNQPYVKLKKREDAVIYEVSVRDFTISNESGVKNGGTYSAFIEKLPYIKDLGVTHVQLLPVVNFFYNDESNKKYEATKKVHGNNYNWGYDPHNYFTPEGWYASDASDPYCRVRELRSLIDACHKAGLGVILDVVYNHMATTKFLDDIVPYYYFRTDEKGVCRSSSGCGNDTATERQMMKRLVVDSTRHWVKNYKVDGFRFDLMGLMEASCVEEAYKECKKLNKDVLFIGEGWKMYNGGSGVGMDQNYMRKTNDVAVFNDEFRDAMKAGGFNETGLGFITGKNVAYDALFANCAGKPRANYKADDPGDNVNYTTCHDGLTLHDVVVNNLHLNEKADKKEIVARLKLGNFMILTSQGIAFLHAGQERGRTKANLGGERDECVGAFVRNSYDSGDDINEFPWKIDEEYEDLARYTKGLLEIRKAYEIFRLGDAKKVSKKMKKLSIKSPLVFGYVLDGKWVILVNASKSKVKVDTTLASKGNVKYFADKEKASAEGFENAVGVTVENGVVTLESLTACIYKLD